MRNVFFLIYELISRPSVIALGIIGEETVTQTMYIDHSLENNVNKILHSVSLFWHEVKTKTYPTFPRDVLIALRFEQNMNVNRH